MSDTEDLTGTTWRDVRAIGDRAHVCYAIRSDDNEWRVTFDGDPGLYVWPGSIIRAWTRVPEKAEPAEVPLAPWEKALLAGGQLDPKPSDVHDGDLLTGTLYGNPYTDWPAHLTADKTVYFGTAGGVTRLIGAFTGNAWFPAVTVSSRKPAPTPPLPWVEHPDAWWQSAKDGWLTPSPQMGTFRNPADWQRVAVVPWGLIEKLRTAYVNHGTPAAALFQAILDAADES